MIWFGKNKEAGFAAIDAVLIALFYVMFSLAISVSSTSGKTALDAKGSDLDAAFNEVMTKLTETGDDCPSSLDVEAKAICRTARDVRRALAQIGVSPDTLRNYVAANPGVLAEAWSVVLATDDDDDGLIEFSDIESANALASDMEFEADFIKKDFSNGVSSDEDSSITFGGFVSAWNQTVKFTKAWIDVETPGGPSKGGGDKGNKGKKGDKAGKGKGGDKAGKGNKGGKKGKGNTGGKKGGDKGNKGGKKGNKGGDKGNKGGKKGNKGKKDKKPRKCRRLPFLDICLPDATS